MKLNIKFYLLGLILIFSINASVKAQTFETEFGKNRVQYHNSIWSSYESDKAVVYFYQDGQALARYTLQYVEKVIPKIEALLEHSLSDKLQIMVYHNHSDAVQTNIGIGLTRNNQGGITEVLGDKIFIYYQGDYHNLEQQINRGIAQSQLDHMIFGSSMQEIVQNAVLLELPDWFKNGLVAYVAKPWSTTHEAELQRYLNQKKLKNFNNLFPHESTLAGHALWYYIAQNYGETAISNILYITRINRSIDAGFRFVTGKDSKALVQEWRANALETIEYDAAVRDSLQVGEKEIVAKTKKRHSKASLTDLKIAPNAKYIAYSHNENGKLRVFLLDTETKKTKKILKTGFKTYELPLQYNYPLLAFDKKSQQLAVVYEKRDVIWLELHNFEEKTVEKAPITKFQQIIDIAFTNNSREMVFSGVRQGISDLYLYNIPNTKTTRLTDDVYDDVNPEFGSFNGQEGILFTSNRPNDTLQELKMDSLLAQQLPFNDFDVFFYQLNNEKQLLVQISDTPMGNEKQAIATSDSTFAFLSDQNGIFNIYSGSFDSVFVKKDTILTYKDSIITNPKYPVNFNDPLILNTEFVPVYKRIGKYKANTNVQKSIEFWDFALKGNQIVSTNRGWKQYALGTSAGYPVFKNQYAELDKTPYFKYEATQVRTANFSSNKTKPNIDDLIDNLDTSQNQTLPQDTIALPIQDTAKYYYQSDLDFWDISEKSAQAQVTQNNIDPENPNNPTDETNLNTYGNEFNPNLLYRNSKARVYKPRFAIDYVAGQLNTSDPQFYQTTGTYFNQINNIPQGAVSTFADNSGDTQLTNFSMGISDLFEDYKLIGTAQIPISNLNTYVLGVEFQNLKKRIDQSWLIQRRKDVEFIVGSPIPDFPVPIEANKKIISTIFQNTLTYPIDITRSVRLKTAIRNDKHIPLTEYLGSVFFESTSENLASMKLEYVFDNTIQIGVNLIEGLRYKFFTEVNKPFIAGLNDSQADFSIKNTGYIGIAGFDIRHYYKVHRKIIWANRLASGLSFGPKRILYYLGDVNGTFIPSYDTDTPVKSPDNGEYILEAAAPNLRGFKSNVRNGSKYVLFSSELRVPLFAYLFTRPIKSQFFRDFQVLGFLDAGTAWENGTPFSEENRYYTYQYPDQSQAGNNSPVITSVQYFKNPIVYGYGMGVRTTLLGYFVKLDVGWGVDSGYTSKARWHFSVGYDF